MEHERLLVPAVRTTIVHDKQTQQQRSITTNRDNNNGTASCIRRLLTAASLNGNPECYLAPAQRTETHMYMTVTISIPGSPRYSAIQIH